MKQKQKLSPSRHPAVVGTVHSAGGWREALRLRPKSAIDFVELRLDSPALDTRRLREGAMRVQCPLILTARHPAEGGAGQLTAAARRRLLLDHLEIASVVDVELRSVKTMQAVLDAAAQRRVVRLLSFHDFRRTPTLATLRRKVDEGRRAGAEVVKIAVQLRSARDLAVLLQLQASARIPLATMGMGPLGRISRLVLAAAGSRLNYGYLDRPQVPGQWPAAELARRIGEVCP
jgi:3-dehydroquinate dehydratase-1